jgi:hypothetical protein
MRSRALLLLSIAVLLLSACGVGYNYKPLEIDCNSPPQGAWICHPNFIP